MFLNKALRHRFPTALTTFRLLGDVSHRLFFPNFGKNPVENLTIDLVDDDLWSWKNTAKTDIKMPDSVSNEETSGFSDDLDDIEELRFKKKLFYKVERDSREFEECGVKYHRRKSARNKEERRKEGLRSKVESVGQRKERLKLGLACVDSRRGKFDRTGERKKLESTVSRGERKERKDFELVCGKSMAGRSGEAGRRSELVERKKWTNDGVRFECGDRLGFPDGGERQRLRHGFENGMNGWVSRGVQKPNVGMSNVGRHGNDVEQQSVAAKKHNIDVALVFGGARENPSVELMAGFNEIGNGIWFASDTENSSSELVAGGTRISNEGSFLENPSPSDQLMTRNISVRNVYRLPGRTENPSSELLTEGIRVIDQGRFQIKECGVGIEGLLKKAKRDRSPTYSQLTDPYHLPFCLDIFITKGSVRACIIHRVSSKVVAVAHSISKDMKFDLKSRKDATACDAVGSALAQRALADDIHNVVYTPRKREKIEGKLEIVLKSIIDNGIDVKVKLKNKRPFKPIPADQS